MTHYRMTALAGLAIVMALAPIAPARASTMPGADDKGVRFGAGIGPEGLAVSLDAPVTDRFRLGGSVGTGYPLLVPLSLDVRGTYLLPSVGVPHLDLILIGGVVAGIGFPGVAAQFGPGGGIEAGAGASYTFVPKLVGRVNIVYGVPFVMGLPWYMTAPAAGIELGYKFSPRIEGTIGYSGRDEVLGVRMAL